MLADVTTDAFLGGRLHLKQPKRGYRAGVDAVLLAASVPAQAGQSVLELGCGAGAAILCLGVRVAGLTLVGAELQADYAALARENAAAAGLALDVHTADVAALPDAIRQVSFDHVMVNPPYFVRGTSDVEDATRRDAAPNRGRELSMGEGLALPVWIDAAVRRLPPGGWLTLIQRVERLPEALAALDARMGAVQVCPLVSRDGCAPERFMLRACKGRRTPFRLVPVLVLHEGSRHLGESDAFTPRLNAVLRNAASLAWD